MKHPSIHRSVYFILVAVVLPALVLLAGWKGALEARKDAEAALEAARSDLADLKGSFESERKDSLPTMELDQNMLWATANGNSAVLIVQQEIYTRAADADLAINSLAPAAAVSNTTNATFAFDIEGQGDHAAVAGFLTSLSEVRPPIAVNFMSLRQVGMDHETGKNMLSIRLLIWAFSEGPVAK